MRQSADVPVLIVGGGPVGLLLAVGLRHFGVDCLVAEKHASTLDFPKGRRVTARTVEIFRQWGLEATVSDVSLPQAGSLFAFEGETLLGADFRRRGLPVDEASRPSPARDHAVVLKVWSKRHRDLARLRCQAACRLHAALCQIIPGGVPKPITAAAAAALLEANTPAGPVQAARHQFAAELAADLRQLDDKLRQTRKQLTAAVRASGTTLTGIFGVGPVIAATIIGDTADISRFPDRDHFAAYNGTAPVQASSGKRKVFRLSRRGNRRMNHAIHMAAVTQIRQRHSEGRAYYDKKIAEGKTGKEALRALKRRVSDAVYRQLQADARAAAAQTGEAGPGGQPGNDCASSAAGSYPGHRLFGPATPGPAPTLRPRRAATRAPKPASSSRQQAARAARYVTTT